MDLIVYAALAIGAFWWMRRTGEISRPVAGHLNLAKRVHETMADGYLTRGLDHNGEVHSATHKAIYEAIREYLADVRKSVSKLLETPGNGAVNSGGTDEMSRFRMAWEFTRIFKEVVEDYDQRRNRYAPSGSAQWDFK